MVMYCAAVAISLSGINRELGEESKDIEVVYQAISDYSNTIAANIETLPRLYY